MRLSWSKHVGLGVSCAALLTAPVYGEESTSSARIRELESKLERSMQMIESLQRQMQKLEVRQSSASAPR